MSARIYWALGLLLAAWALASSMGETGWALTLPLTAALACTAAAICLLICEDTNTMTIRKPEEVQE